MLSPPLVSREDRGDAVQGSSSYLSDGASISMLFFCCCEPGSSEARGLFIESNANAAPDHFANVTLRSFRNASNVTLRNSTGMCKLDVK